MRLRSLQFMLPAALLLAAASVHAEDTGPASVRSYAEYEIRQLSEHGVEAALSDIRRSFDIERTAYLHGQRLLLLERARASLDSLAPGATLPGTTDSPPNVAGPPKALEPCLPASESLVALPETATPFRWRMPPAVMTPGHAPTADEGRHTC